jgi:hypothetical protein
VFLDEDSEYSHSAMLHREFLYTPTPELLALGRGNVYAHAVEADLGSLEAFLADLFATSACQIQHDPIGVRVCTCLVPLYRSTRSRVVQIRRF